MGVARRDPLPAADAAVAATDRHVTVTGSVEGHLVVAAPRRCPVRRHIPDELLGVTEVEVEVLRLQVQRDAPE